MDLLVVRSFMTRYYKIISALDQTLVIEHKWRRAALNYSFRVRIQPDVHSCHSDGQLLLRRKKSFSNRLRLMNSTNRKQINICIRGFSKFKIFKLTGSSLIFINSSSSQAELLMLIIISSNKFSIKYLLSKHHVILCIGPANNYKMLVI